jgi:hypothetical protein
MGKRRKEGNDMGEREEGERERIGWDGEMRNGGKWDGVVRGGSVKGELEEKEVKGGCIGQDEGNMERRGV